jgi:hypothetical protein
VLLLPHPHYKFSLEGILPPISTFICPLVGCLCYGLWRRVNRPYYDIFIVPTDNTPKGSSFAAGERMQELVKVCSYLTPQYTFFLFQVQTGMKN